LLSKYENFTLEWRGKFEGYVSFGEARGEGEHRGFLELCNYKIPSMILLLTASHIRSMGRGDLRIRTGK